MKNDLEPYSYDPLNSFYGSAIGSYPPSVTQPSFPSNNVHSQPGSAFSVVQSNSNFPSNQSTFQGSDFGFTPISFTQSSKLLVEHVSVIQPRHPVSHYSSDFSNPLNLQDKPHRQKDGHSLFSNTSPASCHSPHHPDNLNPDDILNMAMTGMLAADHDLQHRFPDPGPLPSINTVFMSEADKPCY